MNENNLEREKRERAAKLRLGADKPRCAHCGRDNPLGLEKHHIAGRAYDHSTVTECSYCHSTLSDWQKDHPKQISHPPSFEESLMHFLLGMADMFELLVRTLREFANKIKAKLKQSESAHP